MIETKVDGDPDGLERVADWLRNSLRTKVSSAAEAQVGGRRAASRAWDGEGAEAYQAFTKPVLRATDEHVPRIERAAVAMDQLVARLRTHEREMINFRERARAGGLTVAGTKIQAPPDAPSGVFEPGSAEESAHREATAKVELFNALADEVPIAQDSYSTWVAAEMTAAVVDARERDDLAKVSEVIGKILPGFLIGWSGLSFKDAGRRLRNERNRQKRRTKNSRNPDWSKRQPDQTQTPKDFERASKVIKFLDKWGRVAGPVGIGIDVLGGVVEGVRTGDWVRAGLTTAAAVGTGLAVGAALTGLTAGAVATAPVWGSVLIAGGVALATGVAAWGVSSGVGWVYDHRGDIADWTGDRANDVEKWARDQWEATPDTIGDAWDTVTPW